MRARRRLELLVLLLSLGLDARAARDQEPAATPTPAEPREIGLVEKAARRIVQLDVTVRGPEAEIATLGPEDFELAIDGRIVSEFTVDRLCGAAADSAVVDGTTTAAAVSTGTVPRKAQGTNYLFYFDQHHLTISGRQRAIDETRRMVPELLSGGHRAALASSGDVVEVLAGPTSDAAPLLAALERLEHDRRFWDMYPTLEDTRVRDLVNRLHHDGRELACSLARFLQLEDARRSERALSRLTMALDVLAAWDPPKIAVYFADTLRPNAGSFYFDYVGRCERDGQARLEKRGVSQFGVEHALDRVIAEAAANGIRIYTVQAEGLVTPGGSVRVPDVQPSVGGGSGLAARGTPDASFRRIRRAQDALVSLAAETGGRPFLNGIPAPKMVSQIRTDLGCLYVLSFDAAGLRLDRPLRVVLHSARAGVEARTRGQLVVASESAQLTSRLVAAFVAPEGTPTEVELRASVVPLGFENRRYRALVQLVAPASPVAEGRWDMGASLVAGGEIREDAAGHVAVDRAGVPAVFETEMAFRPGPFELIGVAHEAIAGQLGTIKLEGQWPDPEEASVSPIVLLQLGPGAFLRDGTTRSSGSLGRTEGSPVGSAEPSLLVSLVCRGAKKRPLRIERSLSGEATTDFPPLDVEPTAERCVQVRDAIPPRTLTEGSFVYTIRVLDAAGEIARGSREFHVGITPAAAP